MTRSLVLMGGGTLPQSLFDESLDCLLENNNSKSEPDVGLKLRRVSVLISTLASSDPEASLPVCEGFRAASKGRCHIEFEDFGADAFQAGDQLGESSDPKAFPDSVLEQLLRADLLFFTGGDQGRILDALGGTAFEDLMLARWRAGELVLSGTSAGLQVFSQLAFTGETLSKEGAFGEQPETRRGFGALARHLVLDQHFLKRNRLQRLMAVCYANHPCLGLGVDEETALVLRFPSGSTLGKGKVVGNSAVCYLDTRSSQRWKTSWEGVRSGLVWPGGEIPFDIEMG